MTNEKRLNCPMRHENGNCLPCGGFCTAVNDPICKALHNAFKHGESAEWERHSLASAEESRKFQQEQLEALREIYKKVTSTTVDAVEVDDMREFAKDVAYQFGYYCHNGGRLHITHGGLSTLEYAFDILGWKNPHPVPECECEIDGCHEHATCGAPTNDGYKRMCGRHFIERRNNAAD